MRRHILRESPQACCPPGEYQDDQQGKIERKSRNSQDPAGTMVGFGTLRFIHGYETFKGGVLPRLLPRKISDGIQKGGHLFPRRRFGVKPQDVFRPGGPHQDPHGIPQHHFHAVPAIQGKHFEICNGTQFPVADLFHHSLRVCLIDFQVHPAVKVRAKFFLKFPDQLTQIFLLAAR